MESNSNNLEILKLTEPGATLNLDPSARDYLKGYGLPIPPHVRYGNIHFNSSQDGNKVKLFGQAWLPEHAEATILLIHGYCEHTGSYGNLIQDFTNARFAVAAMDLRGHGLSEGARGHTESSHLYAHDVEQFCKIAIPALTPHRPLYIWAHSMGGLIALQLLLRQNMIASPAAMVITSPLLGFPEVKGIQKAAATLVPILNKITPSFPVAHGQPDTWLSHDDAYLTQRAKDPLIFKTTTPRWFLKTGKAIKEVQEAWRFFHSSAPILCQLAGEEKITNLNSARNFVIEALSSQQHKVIEYPGMRHEIEKEPSIRDRVVKESLAWFSGKKN